MRVGMGGPYGLDFGAIMTMGAALGADLELLADVLPGIEAARIGGLSGEEEGDDHGSDD